MITNDGLYSENFNVSLVLEVLRHAKIVKADLFLERNTYKWTLYLQGGQRVLFKPKLVYRNASRVKGKCVGGCEHPEYEVAGFTINRLLGFKNFPFTTGRILSWTKEVLPVATEQLKKQMQITRDGDVCFQSRCLWERKTSVRCFKNGDIPGAMIYFLRKKVYFHHEEGGGRHEFHPHSKHFKDYVQNLPSDSTYCNILRELRFYKKSRDFGDLLDSAVISYITDHLDQKLTFIKDGLISLSVMFDFGIAIRRSTYERLTQLATSLVSKFQELTSGDPLYPLLTQEQILTVAKRIRMLLSLTNYCIELKGLNNVVMDFL